MYMTVEQLIEKLEEIEDKSKIVFDSNYDPICQVEEDNHTVTIC